MTEPMSAERRPGRPTREAAAALNRQVFEGARAVLIERGRAATMDDVAAAIGVSKLTIYRRFATKDALILALIDHDLDALDHQMRAAVDPDRAPIANLREAARRVFDFVTDAANVRMSRLFLHDLWQDEALRCAIARWQTILRATMLPQIAAAQADGALSADIPARELYAILSELVEGQGERLRYDVDPPAQDELGAVFKSRWDFFLRGAAQQSGN